MDLERLRQDSHDVEWRSLVHFDAKVHFINTTLTNLYHIHAPMRAIKQKHLPAPWLTKEVKILMHKKIQ